MSQFKEGDLVSIEGTVKFHHGGTVHVEVPGSGYGSMSMQADRLRMVRPNLAPGDAITHATLGDARVLGVAGDELWIEYHSGDKTKREVVDLADIKRGWSGEAQAAEPPPAPVGEAQ